MGVHIHAWAYKEVRESTERKDKLETEVREGIWLGHSRNTNEILIGTEHGVVRTYTVWRVEEENRWDGELIKKVKGTPQKPDPNSPGLTAPIRIRFDGPKAQAVVPSEPARPEVDVRRLRITKEHLIKYGYAEGCEGCRFKRAGMKEHRAHTERCRRRILEAMMGDATDKRTVEKQDERAARWLKNQEEEEEQEAADRLFEPREESEDADRDVERIQNENMQEEELSAEAMEVMVLMKIEQIEAESMLVESIREAAVDIAEVYSPPRVTKIASRFGLKTGEAMDLTTGWDFTIERHKKAAMKYVKAMKPNLIIGSPECTMFSTLQQWNKNRLSDEWKEKMMEAKEQIKFVVDLYKEQVKNGRWFLHEHPTGASSWDLEEIQKLQEELGVQVVTADQCMYGLKTWRKKGGKKDVAARKRTKFMTNAKAIAMELNQRCRGEHEHQPLVDGRAKEAAQYPEPLCEAICRGLVEEMSRESLKLMYLCSVNHDSNIDEEESEEEGTEEKKNKMEHEDELEQAEAWDDVSGAHLDAKEVRRARLKELEYIAQKEVWTKISRKEALRRGIKVVGTRWIDVNKGDPKNPVHRSRFVAKEFNDGKDLTIFAATPPLEALRWLISEAATGGREEEHENKVVMISDVARAFFEADATRPLCVELPEEAKTEEDHENDSVALLKKILYETRDAAMNLQK